MTDKAQAAVTYIRFVLEHLVLSPSALAKRAGISGTTLTRMLNDPNYKFTPSMRTLNKIAKASNVDFVPFLSSTDFPQLLQAPSRGIVGGEFFQRMEDYGLTPIIGAAAAGIWYEETAPRYDTLRYLPMKLAESSNAPGAAAKSFALETKGLNINRIAQPGDLLLCERIFDIDNPPNGRHVIVERYSADRQFVEVSARLFTVSGDQWTYGNNSTESGFADQTIEVASGDTSLLRPIALVNFVIRPVSEVIK